MKLFRSLAAAALLCAAALAPVAASAVTAGVAADVKAVMDGRYYDNQALGSSAYAFSQAATLQFTQGTGSGKADLMFAGTRTIAASGTDPLDLAGTLKDPQHQTLTFAKVKAIYVKACAANTNDVVLGGAASNTFTGPFGAANDVVKVKPGGFVLLANPVGWTVTATTGDLLEVDNSSSGTSVCYDVMIIGASA